MNTKTVSRSVFRFCRQGSQIFLQSKIQNPKSKIITLVLTVVMASLHLAEAQQAKVYRVGVILPGSPWYEAVDGLRQGLKELGLEEGKHFVLEIRDAKGDVKAAEEAARNLERE